MSRCARLPFRGWVVSEEAEEETRSIFDMMFIHGTSRFTMADMAERTPLAKEVGIGEEGEERRT